MNVDPSLWGSYAGTFADWEKEGVREPTTHEVVLPMFSPAAQQPTKRYRTIVADPPWAPILRPPIRFDGRESETNSYGTMTNHEIEMLPLPLWAGKDAHLYLWALNSNLVAAHRIAEAWGFTVKTVITWVKGRFEAGRLIQHIGLGNYYRNSTEHVLFGVKGSQSTLNSDMPTAFIAERHAHSEKPAAFYDMVQRMSPGPYLDVFARKQRFGWDTWGDEAFDFRTHGIWHKEEEAL